MAESEILEYVEGDHIALLSITFSGHNGVAKVMRRQAEVLSENGSEVTVYSFESDLAPETYDVIELYAPENDHLNRLYRVLWPLLVLPVLTLAVRLRNYDTIISHKYPFNVACTLGAWLGPTYVYYDHGVAPPELYDNLVAKVYSKLMRRLQAVTARPASAVIAISEFVADELREEWGPRPTAIIYNSPSSFIHEYELDLRDIRSYHNIPATAPVILFVGRITKHKNVSCLLEAQKSAIDTEGTKPYLVLVGKPTQNRYYEQIKAQAGENVRFAGYVEEKYLTSYYAQADVYVTASLWEGCNLTVLEAQQMELPVVAFDAGAHPETVEVPPGRLVPEGDCELLGEQVTAVLQSD
ncbi:glycosyltransferase family 4 protein [Halorhabdus utahensis]|nr:glycosyltransferase family 4 protein [Halorhabdus utahensis]